MSYLVLARKYRPQTFDQVVGQQVVVRTLQNALAKGRLPHALLFSGIRGTGKTTLARIMAKALNCEKGPTPQPCGACRFCREISSGASVDLVEIDGASNRGIQEIRDLRENIRFMPATARYKVIIIDEVHMLTNEAFNALLKTLEEPPEHVVFMFATTELHKIPVTILSRCQRYELQRVSSRELKDLFARLAHLEDIEVEEEALGLIAREAGGSVRDGLSLLDQVFSYCGKQVRSADVRDILGLVSRKLVAEFACALLAADLALVMQLFDQVHLAGLSVRRFGTELLDWFRMLIVRKTGGLETTSDLEEEELALLDSTAGQYGLHVLVSVFDLLLEGIEKANRASLPRFAMEMAFIAAVQVGEVVPVGELLHRLDGLLDGEGAVPAPDSPLQTSERMENKRRQLAEGSEKTGDGTRKGRGSASPAQTGGRKRTNSETSISGVVESTGAEERQDTLDDGVSAGFSVPGQNSAEENGAKECHLDTREARRRWPDFIDYVQERKAWMAAALLRASSVECDKRQLRIRFDDSCDCNLLKNREHFQLLTRFALDFFQQDLTISFEVPEKGGCELEGNEADQPRKQRQALARDPLVLTALEIFNGEIAGIRIGPRFCQPLEGEKQKETTREDNVS